MRETNESMDAKFRPFLRLAKFLSDDFMRQADEWLFLVGHYGASKMSLPPNTLAEWIEFFTHCHDGWKRAQSQIADFLRGALTQEAQLQKEMKEHHRAKDREGQKDAREKAKRVDLEIKIARRMLDVILWTILKGEQSTLRRLVVQGGEHNLSAQNIEDVLPTLEDLNAQPMVMALSTDMLSRVHVGDVLKMDLDTGRIEFLELKSGEKNAQIASTADFAIQSQCEHFEALATAEYSKTDRKHYERVKKQAQRNSTILATIRDERGEDPSTGHKVTITDLGKPIEVWSERIQSCYESLTDDKKWAISSVEECVYLGVYSDPNIGFVGFNGWMDRRGCSSPVFSLTDSFFYSSARPLGSTFLSYDLRSKVLRGEIVVIICLDVLRLIELGNRIRPGSMRLATRAESAMANKLRVQSLTLGDLSVVMRVGDRDTFLGGGILDRIVFDQHLPSQLLEHHLSAGAESIDEPG